MSVSRMKVALTSSQNQRPWVSRKWTKEGLGRSASRNQVQNSAAGHGETLRQDPKTPAPPKTGKGDRSGGRSMNTEGGAVGRTSGRQISARDRVRNEASWA